MCLLHYLHHLGQARRFHRGRRPPEPPDAPHRPAGRGFRPRPLRAAGRIPFTPKKADVYALCDAWGLTVEETGRRARYDFLRRTASAIHAADFIATAHHREDQAETVLLQLLRGTGPQGLSGIPRCGMASSAPCWIPPAPPSRAISAAHGLTYVTDETNLDHPLRPQPAAARDHAPAGGHQPRADGPHLPYGGHPACRERLSGRAGRRPAAAGRHVRPLRGAAVRAAGLRPRMLRLAGDRLPVGKKDFTAAHYRALETLARPAARCPCPAARRRLPSAAR